MRINEGKYTDRQIIPIGVITNDNKSPASLMVDKANVHNTQEGGILDLVTELTKLASDAIVSRERLRGIINASQDPMLVLEGFRIIDANNAFLNSTGYEIRDIIGKKCHEVTHGSLIPCHGEKDPCPAGLVISGKSSWESAVHLHHDKNGGIKFDEVSIGRVTGGIILHIAKDITAKVMRDFYSGLIEIGPNPYLIIKSDGSLIDANPIACNIFGAQVSETEQGHRRITGNTNMIDSIIDEDKNKFLSMISGRKTGNIELRFRNEKGDIRTFDVKIVYQRKIMEAFLIGMHDITHHVEEKEIAQYNATHDTLTGLPNRVLMKSKLSDAIAQSMRNGKPIAISFIDLRGFKKWNDRYGHDFGDKLLIEAGQKMILQTRSTDTVARLGGDEFVVILPEIGNINEACRKIDRITREGSQQLIINGKDSRVAFNSGVALFKPDQKRDESIIEKEGKQRLKGREREIFLINYYVEELLQNTDRDSYIAKAVSKAIGTGAETARKRIIEFIRKGEDIKIEEVLIEMQKGIDSVASSNTTTPEEILRAMENTKCDNAKKVIDNLIVLSNLLYTGEINEEGFIELSDDMIIKYTNTLRIVDGLNFDMTPKDDRGKAVELTVENSNLTQQVEALNSIVDELTEQGVRFQARNAELVDENERLRQELEALKVKLAGVLAAA